MLEQCTFLEGSSVNPEGSPSGTQKRTHDQVGPEICPRCGYGISSNYPGAGEEVEPESMDLDPYQKQILEDQDQDLRTVLRELKGSIPNDDYTNAEHLVKENCNLSQRGRQSLIKLLQAFRPMTPKPGKVRKSTFSSLSSLQSSGRKVFSLPTGKTCGADGVILEQLTKGGWFSTKVEVVKDMQDCDIIILFCPIVSRVGTDVDKAMREITGDKPVILVLMHHTRHDDDSVDNKQWNGTFRNVVLSVNVFFHETYQGGLLECSRNDKAVEEIQKVLKSKIRI